MDTTVIISTCISETVWLPDVLLLECQCKVTCNYIAIITQLLYYCIGNCGQLSSMKGVYRILNNKSFSVGSIIEFQCVHTPYKFDPLFFTQCQAGGQWSLHPRDVCGQHTIFVGHGIVHSIILFAQLRLSYD